MLNTDADTDTEMTRALLTPGERDAIRGDTNMDASTRSSHLSRVRGKIEQLQDDVQLLRKHEPEIAGDVRDAVCEDETAERVERLEGEVQRLETELQDLRGELENE